MIQMMKTIKTEQHFAVKTVPATVQANVLSLSDITAPSPVKVCGASLKAATF